MPQPLLNRRKLITAKIETSPGVEAVPSASTDALLVDEASYTVDTNVLERNFYSDTISPLGVKVGRKLAKINFTMELRSNGATNGGTLGNAARIGRLLRACGFAEAAIGSGTATVGAFTPRAANTGPAVTFTATAGNTSGQLGKYTATWVLGGASTTAKIRVSGGAGLADTTYLRSEVFAVKLTNTAAGTITVNATNPLAVTYTVGGTWIAGERFTITCGGYDVDFTVPSGGTATTAIATQIATALTASVGPFTAGAASSVVTMTFTGQAAGITVTTGSTSIALGTTGATVTAAWTGSAVIGDSYSVTVAPVSLRYTPISSGFETVTLYMYEDGMLHKLTGAIGTFTFDAKAGEYGTIKFEFTGQYVAALNAAIPAATHETTLPPIVELARLTFDGYPMAVETFSYDQGNTVSPRPDMNFADGYNGVRLVDREPKGNIDPEAILPTDKDIWGMFANSSQVQFSCRIGSHAGNTIWFDAPNVQITSISEGDRDGLLTFGLGLRFSRNIADDEAALYFA